MISSPNKDQYANRYIEWLKSAHNSSVLLVSKNKFSKNLGRKLRPELSKMFISSSTSDALWLIEKYNSNPDVPGIDAVIMDADTSALKLVENINKFLKSVLQINIFIIPIIKIIFITYFCKSLY
jgi:hypothetical protein